MTPLSTTAFALPDHLSPKSDPALIAADEQHFAAIEKSLEQSMADLSARLDAERRAPGGSGQQAMDRDNEIHRLTARLRTLRRYSLDLCLGGRGHRCRFPDELVGRFVHWLDDVGMTGYIGEPEDW